MEASKQFKKGIKAVCQHGKGIKDFLFLEEKKKNMKMWLVLCIDSQKIYEIKYTVRWVHFYSICFYFYFILYVFKFIYLFIF